MSESDYPHWKEALFGNGHAANLYCAVKYGFWHAAHLLLAAVLLVVYVAVRLWRAIPSAPNTGASEKVRSVTQSSAGKKVGRVVTGLLFGAMALFCLGWFIYMLVFETVALLITLGAIVGGIALLFGAAWLNQRFRITQRTADVTMAGAGKVVDVGSKAKDKSKDKPLLRRLLGYCPVSMDLEPKWFDNLEERLFEGMDE